MSDLYSFPCPSCEVMLSLSRESAGISGPCPFCRKTITAPPAPATAKTPQLAGTETAFVAETFEEDKVQEADAPEKAMTATVRAVRAVRSSPLALRIAGAAAALAVGAAGYMAWRYFGGENPPGNLPAPSSEPGIAAILAEPGVPPVSSPVVSPPVAAAQTEKDGPAAVAVPASISSAVIPEVPAAVPAVAQESPVEAGPAPAEPPSLIATAAGAPADTAATVAAEKEQPSPVIAAAPPPRPAAPRPPSVPANPEDPAILLREPRAVLLSFLKAPAWQERLKLSQGAERIRNEMESYYKTHSDGPVTAEIDFMSHEFIEGTSRRVWFFKVLPPGKAAIPVALEETEDGIKVDWRAFVEGYDGRLASYCEKWQEDPGTFYVAAQRGHWFGPALPDQASRVCFGVIPPTGDGIFKVWVDRKSKVWTEKFAKDGRGEWGRVSNIVVSLKWERSGEIEWISLVDVTADSWRVDAAK